MSNSKNPRPFEEQRQREILYFKKVETLDSRVFVEIPNPNLNTEEYKKWLVQEVEEKWMRDFNGNKGYVSYISQSGWNQEGGIEGKFGENYFGYCKLYHHDGTREPYSENDWRAKRGLLIRDHYSKFDVTKVHLIADNLCKFLNQEGIENTRINFDEKTRMPISS